MTRMTTIVLAIVLVISSFLIGSAIASTSRQRLVYREVGGDGPKLVIRGYGCLQSEDSLELRVVSYEPGPHQGDGRIVYRCVKP